MQKLKENHETFKNNVYGFLKQERQTDRRTMQCIGYNLSGFTPSLQGWEERSKV